MIPGFDSVTIGCECIPSSRKRADQHQQSRLRQVKVGEQRLHHFYVRAGREKDVGSAGMGFEAADARTVL